MRTIGSYLRRVWVTVKVLSAPMDSYWFLVECFEYSRAQSGVDNGGHSKVGTVFMHEGRLRSGRVRE